VASGLNPGVHASWATRAEPRSARIDVAGFVGLAERGPMDGTRMLEGWPQFVAAFGDFQPFSFLAYAVRAFFDNGGRRCHVARVAAPAHFAQTAGAQAADGSWSNLDDATPVRAGALATIEQSAETAATGAQPADRLSSLVLSTVGFVAGAVVTVRQTGAAPVRMPLAGVDPVANRLSWREPLPPDLDLAQALRFAASARDERLVAEVAGDQVRWTRPLDGRFDLAALIRFGFGAAAAGATLWDESGEPLISVTAASEGRWGDRLQVRVTTSFAAEIPTRRLPAPGPADLLTLERVTGLAIGATVEIVQDGVAPVRNVLVEVVAAAAQVRLAHPLAGFDLAGAASGLKPIRLRRLSFALAVRERGRLVETFADLDLPRLDRPDDSRVNEASSFIRIARLPATDDRWLDPGSPLLVYGETRLAGGRDGIAMVGLRDFTGAADAPERRGLRLFEVEDEAAAIAIPDLHLPPRPAVETLAPEPEPVDPCILCPPPSIPAAPPPFAPIAEATPALAADAVLAVQQALVEHCELRGDRIALLDPPRGGDGASPYDRPALLDWRQRFDSSYACCYFPWVAVVDPIARLPDRLREVPPSGHALGQFAAADVNPAQGAPANRPLACVSALPRSVDDEEHALLNEAGINAILARPGRGIRIMGARALSSLPDWKQLVVRRLLLRLKRSLAAALRWAVFEPANRAFEISVVATIESLLEREWQDRRLAGASVEEAFFVSVVRSQAASDAGQFVVDIGVAPALPAEFVMLRLVRSLDRLDLAEAGEGREWPQ
jgi:Bacteriophage tail sheath protein